MSDQLVGLKRVSLNDVAAELDESCFALVQAATYEDIALTDEANFSEMTKREQIKWQLDFVRNHFVTGKIKAWDGTDFVSVDMTADHATATKDIADHLYSEIMGFGLDPKAIRAVVAENESQMNEEKSTETPSSEASSESPEPTSES